MKPRKWRFYAAASTGKKHERIEKEQTLKNNLKSCLPVSATASLLRAGTRVIWRVPM